MVDSSVKATYLPEKLVKFLNPILWAVVTMTSPEMPESTKLGAVGNAVVTFDDSSASFTVFVTIVTTCRMRAATMFFGKQFL